MKRASAVSLLLAFAFVSACGGLLPFSSDDADPDEPPATAASADASDETRNADGASNPTDAPPPDVLPPPDATPDPASTCREEAADCSRNLDCCSGLACDKGACCNNDRPSTNPLVCCSGETEPCSPAASVTCCKPIF